MLNNKLQKQARPQSHDGDNLRASKTTNGVTTNHILDGMNVVADISGTTTNSYSRGLSLYASKKGTQIFSYTTNIHGDISAEIDSQNTIKRDYYDNYGNIITEQITDMPFGYTGEYTDTETGLIYLRNRYYDPEICRFISEDPIMDGTNWYSYCNGNPVMFVDPSGTVLMLSGDAKYWAQTMSELQALTDDTLKLDSETGIVTISSYGKGNKSVGTELVSTLINDVHTIQIERNAPTRGTEIDHMNNGNSFVYIKDKQISDDSTFVLVQNSDGSTSLESYKDTPSYIFLGHELIHAYRNALGIFNKSRSGHRYYVKDGKGNEERISMSQYDDEYETVGLSYSTLLVVSPKRSIHPRWISAKNNRITENALRKEHGLRLRMAYKTFN